MMLFKFAKHSMFLLLLFIGASAMADIELSTSITDVDYRGSREVTGSITMRVNDNDFGGITTETPAFIRITLDKNARLADTLVDLTSEDVSINDPILLAMFLSTGTPGLVLDAAPDSVSIVRWVAGERSIWIRVQTSSSEWILDEGVARAPDGDNKVGWNLGLDGNASAQSMASVDLSHRNLDFNSRNDNPVSVSIWVDLSESALETGGVASLLHFDIITFDANAEKEPGLFGASNDLGVNFSNDFTIARGVSNGPEIGVRIPHITRANGGFTTTLLFSNTGFQQRNFEVIYYNARGPIGPEPYQLAGEGTLEETLSEFEDQDITHAEVFGAEDVEVIVVYQAAREGSGPAHVAVSKDTARKWRIYAGNPNVSWDGVAVVNTGTVAAQVTVTHKARNGALLAPEQTIALQLAPNQKMLSVLSDLFDHIPGSTFEISSAQPLAIMALRGSLDSEFLWQNPATAFSE